MGKSKKDTARRLKKNRKSRFADSEALREVLIGLHNDGSSPWRHNPTANELLAYLVQEFAPLARKHGL